MMQTESILQKDPQQLNKQDLAEIYELLSPRLFRYAYRLLGDSALAEDCVSETFSKFLNAMQRGVGPRDQIKAYLYRIAHNWITDYYRQHTPTDSLDAWEFEGTSAEPAFQDGHTWERQQIRQALLRLPAVQRQIVLLRFFEEWSHEEIAAATGKTVEATRALQYRALNGLRGMLVLDEVRG